MKIKLAVAAVLVFGAAAAWLEPLPSATVPVAAPAFELLPATLGGVPIVNEWHNRLAGTIVEDVAEYKPVFGQTSVMLAFFRGRSYGHNGIGCLIARGHWPVWQKSRMLQTASGSTAFVVALLQAPGRLQMVASTQCRPAGCRQELYTAGHDAGWLDWGFRDPWAPPTSTVPVTIIVSQTDTMQAEGNVEEQLARALRKTAAELDLRRARQLAAIQQGDRFKQASRSPSSLPLAGERSESSKAKGAPIVLTFSPQGRRE